MATFGQGINPQLGAIDYSPILKGSVAGAEMAAKGGQMIGQGLANLGQEIGQGVQKYFKEQEENTGMMGNLTATSPKTLIEASKDPRIAKALEGLKVGKSPKREDLLYATAKIANLEKNEIREFQRFQQDTEIARVAEEKRIRAALPQLLRPVTDAEKMLQAGVSFADLGKASKDVFKEVPVGAMEFLKRGMEQGIPVAILAPVANQITEQSKVDAAIAAGPKPTTAMQNAQGVVEAEIAAGLYPPDSFQAKERYAAILATGGREVGESYAAGPIMADNVSGANATPTVRANRGKYRGQIGTVGKDGTFTPIDLSKFSPVSPGDVNAFLGAPEFQKLSDTLIAQENSIKQLKRYSDGVGTLSTGIDKAATAVSALIKTSITKQPLSEDEKTLGLSVARQQGLLGAFKGVILGGGVLTEQDAMRILERFGGDIQSIFTNPEIVKQAINEVLQDKMNEYQQTYNVYSQGVIGRYGKTGYPQRSLVSIEEKPTAPQLPIPAGSSFDYSPDKGLTPTQ